MAGYINRLIKRTNGQVPVIRHLVRSGYGTLPLISEPVTEFEESLTFNEDTNSPVSRIETPVISQVKSPWITGENNTGETPELVRTSDGPEERITQDASLYSIRPVSRSSTGSPPENDRAISPERKIIPKKTKGIVPEIDNTSPNAEDNIPAKRKAPLRSKQENGRDREVADRQREPVARIPITPPDNRHVTDKSPRRHNSENVLDLERTGVSQLEIAEAPQVTPVKSRQNSLQESELPLEVATEEPADAIRQVHPVRRYIPEANLRPNERMKTGRMEERSVSRQEGTPATNIRVTIGRVEIKAVPQPERQIQRAPAAPRGPVVTLDAYLEGRDEEGR